MKEMEISIFHILYKKSKTTHELEYEFGDKTSQILNLLKKCGYVKDISRSGDSVWTLTKSGERLLEEKIMKYYGL
ncbi:MAG: hypothetical protein KQA33_01420 [Candidatus Aenigmarchaeota archaeon]|nr:hypothetical protein [Candidatus Aenigmarchaeota archaeon]